jgi:hypothetical protein
MTILSVMPAPAVPPVDEPREHEAMEAVASIRLVTNAGAVICLVFMWDPFRGR